MSQVLIWKKVFPGSDYDIFNRTDYHSLYEHVQTQWGGVCQNWGNRLWLQGIFSELDTGENDYHFLTGKETADEINNSYDFIILPMANIFYRGYVKAMKGLTAIFEQISIPIYVIACGVQADSYDCLERVVSEIGETSSNFIRAIYNTGGDFALRGFFTKEFFSKLGFHDAVVTGCPSLYQLGSDFRASTAKQAASELKPVFNGRVAQLTQVLKAYPESVFVDQCDYYQCLYYPNYLAQTDLRFMLNFAEQFDRYSAHLLSQKRIVMIADMNEWSYFLKMNGFNYSFGSRIHGTIMAILSGIPSTILCCDSRTREMAEFFDIPNYVTDFSSSFSVDNLLKLYERTDYTRFNQTFSDKFQNFENFLSERGIVSHINTENHFFTANETLLFQDAVVNTEQFSGFAKKLDRYWPILRLANRMKHLLRG